jgi:hypothetical protein
MSDLKDCLYDLALFIAKSLNPNRLQNFDIELIKQVKDFDNLPDKVVI